MKRYKQIIMLTLIILTIFSIICGVSANDLTNTNSSTHDTNDKTLNLKDNTNSINEKTSTTQDNTPKTIAIASNSKDTNKKTNINTEKLGDSATIYVAPNEDPEYGEGSENKPFSSINNAINLAKTKSGKIIIKEGNYHENGITIDGDNAISIIGEGQVIIDNTGLDKNSIFTIETKDVTIKNIIFRNNEAKKHGSAFNIVGESQTNPIEVNILIDNCSFENLEATRGTAIYAYNSKGNINITNSNFTNSKATWASICIQESSDTGGLNLKIDGSKFANNYANNAGALYISKAANVTITNSIFYNNTATNSPGAMYINNCTAKFDNCLIYNNTATNNNPVIVITRRVVYNTGYDDDSSTSNNLIIPTNVVITNCIIENNTPIGSNIPVIRLETSNLNISYSSIVNGFDIENTIKESLNNDKPGTVIANNNWWGTNDPLTKVIGNDIQIDNWIIMNIVPTATKLDSGDTVKVNVDFNHIKTKSGEIKDFKGWNIPKSYIVKFKTNKGTINSDRAEIKYGETKNIIYTANTLPDILTIECDGLLSDINFKDKSEPYYGVIYVSKTGNDNNEGSIEYPVSSINKAIELASVTGGSGQIIITSGTYTGHSYEITKNLKISGQGTVILDGEGKGSIFYAPSSVSNLSLSNLILKGGNHDFGAAIRSYASKTVLDHITITGINDDTGDLILAYYDLIINNTKISSHKGGDLISSSGNIIINNSLFENNLINASTSDYGVISQSSSQKRTLTVENSEFINNIARQGVVYSSNDAIVKIKDSEFINNTNLIGSGGAILANQNSKLDVYNCVFINNYAKKRNGGAINIGSNAEAIITKSSFINNGANENGDSIYNNGQLKINYSVLLTNSSKAIIYTENAVNAAYNWWGTNDNPKNLVSNKVDASNWVIMNIDIPNEINNNAIINIDFKHYTTSDGLKELKENIPELKVNVDVVNGTVDKKELTTSSNIAKVVYTVNTDGYDTITFKSSDMTISKTVKVSKKQTTSALVNPDNINLFFDSDGLLNPSITSQELIFTGKFDNLNLKINKAITLIGRDALFNNTSIQILEDNVKVINLNFVADKIFKDTNSIIYIEADNVIFENNTLKYNGPNTQDSYAIYVCESDGLELINNNINYNGKLGENTNTIAVYSIKSSNMNIKDNNIIANIPGVAMDPTRSAGLVLDNNKNISLMGNTISVNYNGFEGEYDTLYSAKISESNNLTINHNIILVNGHEYSYALSLNECNDTLIIDNTIIANSKFRQSNGLDISNYNEVTGIRKYNINYNNISASALTVVYPINFSDINHKSDANIHSNNIKGESKFVYGVYIEGHENSISNNNITVTGNYTTGIISHMTDLIIKNNIINSTASNIGDINGKHPSNIVKAETNGILVSNGKIDIQYNELKTNGKYTIDLINCNGGVKNNKLSSNNNMTGDLSIRKTESSNVEIINNTGFNKIETPDKPINQNETINNNTNNTPINQNETINNNTNNTPLNPDDPTNNTNDTPSNPDNPNPENENPNNHNPIVNPETEHTPKTYEDRKLETQETYINTENSSQSNTNKNSPVRKTNNEKPIIISKNLKIKKSSKIFKIKVTLKLKKKVLKNKKVTLKFKGKTYKSKTNKKGIITFKIPKKVLKKLKVGKTYKYTVKYGKYKVTKKIIIRK